MPSPGRLGGNQGRQNPAIGIICSDNRLAMTEQLSLDAIASNPETATTLSLESRANLLARCASVLAALSAAASRASVPETGEDDQLLTVPEVAQLLRFDEAYVYQLARTGRLPAVRQGKYVRVRRSSLQAWITSQEDQAAARTRPLVRRRRAPATRSA